MRIVKANFVLLLIGFGFLVSCGGGGGSSSEDPIVNLPEKSVLLLPLNGETCIDYNVVDNNDTKAEISFSWTAAAYATSYVVVVTQAGIEVVNQEITTTSYKAVLDKGKTYSWTIMAKNKDGIKASSTNSFITPGIPIGNYVPYAAVINFSVNSSTGMATLSWVGKDEDSNVSELKYAIEIKKDNTVIQSLTNLTSTSIAEFAAILNSTYQIKINTIDKNGSYSSSDLSYTYQ